MLKKELEAHANTLDTKVKELSKVKDMLKEDLDEAYALLAGYEDMLCVKFCGWLNRVMATFKFWKKGVA